MDELLIPAFDRDSEGAKAVLRQYGGPAFLRRARRLEDARQDLLERCRQQRHAWLDMVRLRLAALHALAGDWAALEPLLQDRTDLHRLRELHALLTPTLQTSVEPTRSHRRLGATLGELGESIERFNQRWLEYLRTVDLGPYNALVDGYNRYYLLEKECVVGSHRIARQGFVPKQYLDADQLIALFPPLPAPRGR